MAVRLKLKDEVRSLQAELREIAAKGDKATDEEKAKHARMGRMLQLRQYIEVTDHAVSGYTGKDGAYQIAPAETGDEVTAQIQAVVGAMLDERGSEGGLSEERVSEIVKAAIEERVPALVKAAIEEQLGGSGGKAPTAAASDPKNAGKQPAK